MVEIINNNNRRVAIIVRAGFDPVKTGFITNNEDVLQVGYIVYGAGRSIVPHIHRLVERKICGTPEILYVRKGRVRVDFYNDDKQKYSEAVIAIGDLILLIEGGHGFEMLEDSVMMEVKQGPYLGQLDKERFNNDSGK